ncbi:MAG: hypothetical protein ACJ8C4_05250 [Gemmataceae bacterium]
MARRTPRQFFSRTLRLFRFEDRITPTVTSTFDDTTGTLAVVSNGADSITIGSDQFNYLTINGTNFATSTGLSLEAARVQLINVVGGSGNNVIDLSGVTPLTFPGLQTKHGRAEWRTEPAGIVKSPGAVIVDASTSYACSIDGGSGNDTITGSQVGDYIICASGVDVVNTGRGDNVICIRTEQITSLTINGSSFGHNTSVYDVAAKDAAKMTTKVAVSEAATTVSFGPAGVITSINVQDVFVNREMGEVDWQFSDGTGTAAGFGGAISIASPPGSQADVVTIAPNNYSAGRLKWQVINLKRGITDSMDAWKWRVDPGNAPTMMDFSGTGNSVTVNTFGLSATTTSTGVQVAGRASVVCIGAASITTEKRLYDEAALADLLARGVTITPTVTDNVDGTRTLSVTLSNSASGTTSVTGATFEASHDYYTKKHLGNVKYNEFSSFVSVTPSPGATVSVDDGLWLMNPADAAVGRTADQKVTFTLPGVGPGQSSTCSIKQGHYAVSNFHVEIDGMSGGYLYSVDLKKFFERGDQPTASQFAALIDSFTTKTPTGGASTAVAVTADGSRVLSSSAATGIDPAVTTVSQGAHLYLGGQMVDVSFGGTSSGNAPASNPAMSVDGRWVVFESAATNLVAGLDDANSGTDVFLRDTLLGKTYCLSTISNAAIGTMSTGNGASLDAKISWDGRQIIFRSLATNLDPSVVDLNNEADLFTGQRDNFLQGAADVLTCLSLVPNSVPAKTCNKGVVVADVNRDGLTDNYTFSYFTEATNAVLGSISPGHLIAGRVNKFDAITIKQTVNFAAWTTGQSLSLTVSLDSSTVVFWTNTNIGTVAGVPDTNNAMDILRLGVANGGVECLTRNYLGTATADGASPAHAGESVAVRGLDGSNLILGFTSAASNLISGLTSPASDGVYRSVSDHSPSTGNLEIIIQRIDKGSGTYGSNNANPALSADGFTVAWDSPTNYQPTGTANGKIQVWVKDCFGNADANRIVLVSGAFGDSSAFGNENSKRGILGGYGDGLSVCYSSDATNLVAGDTNGQRDVFCSSLGSTYVFTLSVSTSAAVTLGYDAPTNSVTVRDGQGLVVASQTVTFAKNIGLYLRSGMNDVVTIDYDALQRLGGNILIHGDSADNDRVVFGTGLGKTDITNVEVDYRPPTSLQAGTPIVLSHEGRLLDSGDKPVTPYRVGPLVATVDVKTFEDNSHADHVATTSHITNPHNVTKTQIGLGNVVNVDSMTLTTDDFFASASRSMDLYLQAAGDNTVAVDYTGLPVSTTPNLRIHGDGSKSISVTVTGTNGGAIVDGGSTWTASSVSANNGGSNTITLGLGGGTYVSSGGTYKLFSVTGQPTPVGESKDKITNTGGIATLDASDAGSGVTLNMDSQIEQAYLPGRTMQFTGTIQNATGTPFDDTFMIKGLAVPRTIDGGSVVSGTGDTLIVDAQGKAATVLLAGQLSISGSGRINFPNIEHLVVVNNAPTLQVAAVQINDGSTQRSRVYSLTVGFNGHVDFPNGTAAAFQLTNNISGNSYPLIASKIDNAGFTVVTLTFAPGSPNFGSLPAGAYTLKVIGGQITSPLGGLDGNGDGVVAPGGETYFTPDAMIFCLFGDGNGDRTVDQNDYLIFRNAVAGGPNITYDSNQDGDVDQTDYLIFRNNIGAIV